MKRLRPRLFIFQEKDLPSTCMTNNSYDYADLLNNASNITNQPPYYINWYFFPNKKLIGAGQKPTRSFLCRLTLWYNSTYLLHKTGLIPWQCMPIIKGIMYSNKDVTHIDQLSVYISI